MSTAAHIIGYILLALWAFCLFVAKYQIRRMRNVMRATIFQWNILPFIVAIGLIVTGKIQFLIFWLIVAAVSPILINFFMGLLPLLYGIYIGIHVGLKMFDFGIIGTTVSAIIGGLLFFFSVPIILVIIGIDLDSDGPDSPVCYKQD